MLVKEKVGESGFELSWRPLEEAEVEKDGWRAVHVGGSVPCVIQTAAGHERLGRLDTVKKVALVAWAGKEEVYTEPEVDKFMILCRKP